jgi:hypothetical protein
MASRAAAMAFVGTLHPLHTPAAAAGPDTKCRASWGRTRLSLRRRGLIARAFHSLPQHPSCADEVGRLLLQPPCHGACLPSPRRCLFMCLAAVLV